MKLTFIGGGNMAQAILGGLIATGQPVADCLAIEPDAGAREKLAAIGIDALPTWQPRALGADAIVLAVKPQMMKTALAPLAGALQGQLLISIAAGTRSADISRWLGGYRQIVRTMPNTPALIHAGISGLYAMAGVDATQRALAERLLGAVGKTLWFDEEGMLDAVTAVSGSGPAYVFYLIEALESAALDFGIAPAVARTLALETFVGSARLAAQSSEAPALLRAKVTSPRGTTERAIAAFDAAGLKSVFAAGVRAARDRSIELGDELGKN
jgi:pyrroline-5-carboxylate reductase